MKTVFTQNNVAVIETKTGKLKVKGKAQPVLQFLRTIKQLANAAQF